MRIAVLLGVLILVCAPPPAPSSPAATDKKGKNVKANHLVDEKSPYLRQHAHNPVDWYPWGREALEKAKKEGKPIFLSIGYATCHWCHVMERESFEDDKVAEILNRSFVAIKVDREERPDVDKIYMTAVTSMTGSGGWPLSVFLTPDREPFFGGTYFPPVDGFGRPAFKTLLLRIEELWRERRGDLEKNAARLVEHMKKLDTAEAGDEAPDAEVLAAAARQQAGRFDPRWGGFGAAPKFPPSMTLEMLLRVHRRTGEESVLRMVETTLDRMAAGGMADQLGGGFHRYSTDGEWLVPHFEKMLYDNALLARVYLDAHLVTGHERHAEVARRTLDYVLRDMTQDEGGFSSAEDADSEGEEGTFYVWTREEIRRVLDEEEARLVEAVYGVSEGGNFEGKSILHVAEEPAALAKRRKLDLESVDGILDRARGKLLAVRGKRERPLLDDKVLSGWNGLMIGAMAAGYRVLGDERYLRAADEAADFVLDRMVVDGRLLRRYRDGEAKHLGVLRDYAYLAAGLLDLYETTGEARRLREAKRLIDETERLFSDEKTGAFFDTGDDGEKLLLRTREAYDGAAPSGNSITARNLVRLAALTGERAYRERAGRMLAAFADDVGQMPAAFPALLAALDLYRDELCEVVVVGKTDDPATASLVRAAWSRFAPNRVIVVAAPDGPDRKAAEALVPLLEGRTEIDGKPAAYVCRGGTCKLPVTDPGALTSQLDE